MQLRPDVEAIRTAFGLDEPGELEPITPEDHGGAVWRLGAYAVKRVRWTTPDWWWGEAEIASDFERRAVGVGVNCPRPVEPIEPAVGYFAVIGEAPFRVHEWLDAEPVGSVDVDRWVGATLASLRELKATDGPDRQQYGLHSSLDVRARARRERRPWSRPVDSWMRHCGVAGRSLDAFDHSTGVDVRTEARRC